MRRSELRVISPTPGLEIRAPKPREASPSHTAPFRWACETWEPRRSKERSESEPWCPRGRRGAHRSLRFEVSPRWLFRTPPVTRDACKTGWRPVCVLLHVRIARRGLRSDRPPAKVVAFPKTEGLFTGGIGCRKGSLPETPDRTFAPRGRTSALRRGVSAPFFSEGRRLGLTAPSVLFSLRLDRSIRKTEFDLVAAP